MTESEPNSGQLTEEEYTYYAAEDESLSEAVIYAVSTFTDCEPSTANATGTQKALESLYNRIDPDALDSLFQTSKTGDSMVGTVEFWYCGCEVTVDSTGFVIVTKR